LRRNGEENTSSLLWREGAPCPKLLVTGFGPFPGAPRNPTEALIAALAEEPAEAFGASALKALVLPTDYRRSWAILRRYYASYAPDVVVHFGLSERIGAIHVERVARNRAGAEKLDIAGYAPRLERARRSGPHTLQATLSVESVHAALTEAGIPAALSDDAGAYVCNATLYRSLHVAPPTRHVGFIHVPPEGRRGLSAAKLKAAASLALATAAGAWTNC
jgi:pyroglutamyl-peptidase